MQAPNLNSVLTVSLNKWLIGSYRRAGIKGFSMIWVCWLGRGKWSIWWSKMGWGGSGEKRRWLRKRVERKRRLLVYFNWLRGCLQGKRWKVMILGTLVSRSELVSRWMMGKWCTCIASLAMTWCSFKLRKGLVKTSLQWGWALTKWGTMKTHKKWFKSRGSLPILSWKCLMKKLITSNAS